jgi:hypothetical protein
VVPAAAVRVHGVTTELLKASGSAAGKGAVPAQPGVKRPIYEPPAGVGATMAAVVGTIRRRSATTTAAGGTAGSSTSPATSARPSTAKPPAHTDPADPTICSDHIGQLKIGMSPRRSHGDRPDRRQRRPGRPRPDTCIEAHWQGQSNHVWMVFNGKYGLRALDSFGNQETPEGIKPGSTLAAVRRAYPRCAVGKRPDRLLRVTFIEASV